jgi:predicted nucleic acid-binding protein
MRPRSVFHRIRQPIVEARSTVGLSSEKAAGDLERLSARPLTRYPTGELVQAALDMAVAHRLTVYDACCATLAQELGLPLPLARN